MSHTGGVTAAITANLSGHFTDVTPPPVPDNATFPYITILEIGAVELESLTGKSGLVRSVMQVNCWSKDYEECWALRKLVKDMLMAFTGAIGGETIDAVNHSSDRQLYDPQRELHECVASFIIWWES
jgi:hypothetical protein